jgi:hypothetical protein
MPVKAMKRTILIASAVVLAVAGGATTFVIATRPEPADPHVVRGKEFLSVQELGPATSEFKIALKKRPDSEEAKALLLYARARADSEGAATMFTIYPVLTVIADPEQVSTVPAERRAELTDMVKKLRAFMYEEGIDTRDPRELAAIVKRAARFAFEEAVDAPDADHAAYALASDGDEKALAHLCERLKSDKAVDAPELLEKLGTVAVEPLRAIVADRHHLGRARAAEVLSKLLARELARELFASEPSLRGLELADLPEALRSKAGGAIDSRYVAALSRQLLSGSALVDLRSDAAGQLASFYAPLAEDRGVLALQGYDQKGKWLRQRLYLFEGGKYQSAEVVEDGRPMLQSKPIARLTAKGPGKVEIAFLAVTSVAEERRVKRSAFTSGDRVALRKGGTTGTVAGTDEFGLIQVRLDTPVQGMSNLELASGMLLGLDTVMVEKAGYEVRQGRISGRRIEFGAATPVASLTPVEQPAGEEDL